jgi:hypothetical protein
MRYNFLAKRIALIQLKGDRMTDKLALFKETYCFNKNDVQREVNNYIEQFESDSQNYELCKRFQYTLNQCSLPQLTAEWWFYDYEQINDGIDLKLHFFEEFDVEDNGIQSMTFIEKFTLLSIKCDYLTVEQFSKNNNVSGVTVRQWIRRGKLRTAKKVGRDWIIPSIAPKPSRGFNAVTYYWDSLPSSLLESFPFLRGYDCIYIMKNSEEKTRYDCMLGYPGQDDRIKIEIDLAEREKLELALISCGNVRVEEHGWLLEG